MTIEPFLPSASVLLACSVASTRVALPGAFDQGVQTPTVRLYNAGSVDLAVAFGDVTVVALADGTSMIVKAGTLELFTAPKSATHIAAITLSATATLYITRGEGV